MATIPYSPRTSFLFRKGNFTPLPHVPFADAVWSDVLGVNERGDMVGRYRDSNGNWHVYVAFKH